MLARAALAVLCFCLLPGCSSEVESHQGQPMGECNAVETRFENGSASHVAECSDIEYSMSPPVFGDHYPVWAAYQTYDYPVPFGYLVHALEHGAIVLLYDCPEGCAEEVAEVQAFIDELPLDPRCSSVVQRRVILAPAAGIGARWTAAAWGYSLRADCFDRAIFQRFYDERHGRGREDVCAQGTSIEASACR